MILRLSFLLGSILFWSVPPSPWPLLQPVSAAPDDSADFCSLVMAMKGCAAPPTYDSVVIEDYLGKWYEIGGTAMAKLQKEAGLACYEALYSLADEKPTIYVEDDNTEMAERQRSPSHKDSRNPDAGKPKIGGMGEGVKMHIEERGIARLGMAAKLGVMRLSTAASGICASARRICAGAATESALRDSLYQVSGVVVEISAEHTEEASALSNAIVAISKSLQRAQVSLHHLAGNVSSIQIINGLLSHGHQQKQQQNEEYHLHHHQSLIEDLNKSIRIAMSLHLQLTLLLTSDIESACDSILRVAYSLISSDAFSPSPAASKLLLSARSIQDKVNAMLSALSQMELELIAMSAASSSISVADTSSPPPPPEPASIAGQAVQNLSSPGKLVVSMEGGFSGPYWIIGLEGSASHGYDASLVYSCVDKNGGEDGELHDSLFILSRTSRLPPQSIIVERFLATAKLLGISTLCHNPFLLTLQDCDLNNGDGGGIPQSFSV